MTLANAATRTLPPLGGARAWLIWALGATSFGFAFFQRVAPSVMVSDLMREFAVGAAVLGNLSAIYFYAYAGLQIPIGTLLDRWGPRAMLSVSIALAAAGSLLFGTAENIYAAYAGRLLVGIGSAVGFVGTLALIGRWFPPERFAFLSGMTMLVAMSAGVGGQAPLAFMVQAIGWRNTMFAATAFGAVLCIALWLVVRDRPDEAPGHAAHNTKQGWRQLGSNLKRTAADLRIWNIAGVAAAMSGPMLAFGGLWGVPYLIARYGLDRPAAAFCASLMFIGWAIGAPASGWLSDHWKRRKMPLVTAAVLALVMMLILFVGPDLPLVVAAGLIFATGLASSMMVICFALAREISNPEVHGAATGIVNGFTVGSGALLQPVIGIMLDLGWSGATADGAPVYSVATYHWAFVTLIASGILGVICAALTSETRCRPLHRSS